MRLPLGTPRDLRKMLPCLAVTSAALLATFAFEHWVVHLLVVLPAAVAGAVPPWAIASMVLPELVVLFFAGWRLPTALCVVMLAGVAALLRVGFHLLLALAGEPGHGTGGAPTSELAVTAPVMALAYLLVLGLAATAAHDERRPVERARRGA